MLNLHNNELQQNNSGYFECYDRPKESIALIPLTPPQIALALTADKVKTVAKEITVRIQGRKGGSGVILEKQGSTYYILTSWHVVDKAGDYQVVTPDGKAHSVYYSLVRRVPGMDLAVVPFSSTQSYPLAQLANSAATKGNKAYVAPWPISGGSLRQPIFIATEGQLTWAVKLPGTVILWYTIT